MSVRLLVAILVSSNTWERVCILLYNGSISTSSKQYENPKMGVGMNVCVGVCVAMDILLGVETAILDARCKGVKTI